MDWDQVGWINRESIFHEMAKMCKNKKMMGFGTCNPQSIALGLLNVVS